MNHHCECFRTLKTLIVYDVYEVSDAQTLVTQWWAPPLSPDGGGLTLPLKGYPHLSPLNTLLDKCQVHEFAHLHKNVKRRKLTAVHEPKKQLASRLCNQNQQEMHIL